MAVGSSASASATCCNQGRYCQSITALSSLKKMRLSFAVLPEFSDATFRSVGNFRTTTSSDWSQPRFRGSRESVTVFLGGGLGPSLGQAGALVDTEELPSNRSVTRPTN